MPSSQDAVGAYRSEILGRISRLEDEVATARTERIALEEKLADLTST